MFRPRFNFFITQVDGTIFGSAIDEASNERLAYVIATDGHVSARLHDTWYDLPDDEAACVRVQAGRVYHHTSNYLTRRRIF